MTAVAVLTAIACGGDDDDGTGPIPTISVTASPTSLPLDPGATGTVTVTLVRGGGFADPVNVTIEGLPTGITATAVPAQLTGQTTQVVVTVTVASTVAPGLYTATVRASATGVGSATTTYTVTVNAPPPVPDFTISANPTAVNAAPGGSGNTDISIVRSNLTADVALSLVNPPAGITGTFVPATLTGATLSSALTINVSAGVAAGSYNVTVQGVGGGVTKTTVVGVTVSAAGGNLVWDFCNADPLPLKFWRLSGGTWAEVLPTTVGSVTRYSFTISSATGGVAFTTTQSAAATARIYKRLGRGEVLKAMEAARAAKAQASIKDGALTDPHPETFTLYGLASELSGFAETCPTAPVTVPKTFNVTGIAAGEVGMLGYGGASASLVSTTPSYNLNVVAGTYDWMAVFGPAPTLPDLAQNWAAYRIGRGEATPGAAVAVARAGATPFATFPFTVTGGAAGSFYQFSQFIEGARGDILGFGLGALLSPTASGTALFLATADRLPTDMNVLQLLNTEPVGADGISIRTSQRYLGSAPPASGTFALPLAVPAFIVTGQGGPPVTSWTVAGLIPVDYQTAGGVVSAFITGPAAVSIINATRGWLQLNNQTTNYSLVTPILPGALPAWVPASPLEDAIVTMIGGNLTTTPVAGSVINIGARQQSPP